MTKTNYCTTNNAIGYYPLDSYGYNTILINGTESIGYDDYVYFTFSHYSELTEETANTYHKSKIYENSRGEYYFFWLSVYNLRNVVPCVFKLFFCLIQILICYIMSNYHLIICSLCWNKNTPKEKNTKR